MTPPSPFRRAIRPLAVGALLAGILSGCTAAPTDDANPAASTPVASTPAASPPPAASTGETPEESFRAWLAASREPDAGTACSYLSDGLVERMLAELAANGIAVDGCAEMITTTAELYAAIGESPDAEVETISETADRAELFVTYASADCGTVVLVPEGARWILTEHSEERC
ncbi:hypothetical protein ROT00_09455 [Agromyces mediolanus]|uniref:hypothetical protein n=1 Tax=Agromyces mediolanus TaxID=41986 RepID=UPI00383301AB